jgi:hypothetical protein
MYAEHVPKIRDGMLSDPETFARGVMFAILSIQQPITRVPAMLQDVAKVGEISTALNPAMKYDGWDYMQNHATAVWRDVVAMDTRDALVRLLSVPSLGIVKAAFVLQFLGHDIGCLDTHNLRKLGLPMDSFKNHAKRGGRSVQGFTSRQIDTYFSIAYGQGRGREFWDNWCNERAPAYAMTGDEISALHMEVIA